VANSEAAASGKTFLRRWGGPALAAAFLVGASVFLLRQRGELLAAIEIHAAFLLPLALAEGVMLVARGLLTRELCRAFDVRLRVLEAVSLASWTTLANYVAPLVGGAGMRAVYLKRRHGLLYSHFLSLHAGTYAVHFWIGGLFGLAALALLPAVPAAARSLLALLFVGAFGACSLLMFAPGWIRKLGIRFGKRVERVLEGAERLSAQRRWVILSLLVVNLLAMGAALFCAFELLGVALGPVEALLLATVTSYSVLLSITPASFGITEGVIVFAAGLVGVAAPVALAAAGVKRLASLAVTALAAGVTAATGTHMAAENPEEPA
jgi:uncharacterized membrane protein YbhN (UPF0104 family)